MLAIGAQNECADGSFCKEVGDFPNIIESGPDALLRLNSPCAPFKIWKTSFLKNNDLYFYEGIFHEDCEFTPRAIYKAETVSYYDGIVYNVTYNVGSITRSVNPKKAFDYIDYVCPHLSQFSINVASKYRKWFDRNISIYINNALDNACLMEKKDAIAFENCLRKHRDLYVHLKNSGDKKFIVEYYLLIFSPFSVIRTYKFLHKLYVLLH